MFKKLVALILALALMWCLAACGPAQPVQTDSTDAPPTTTGAATSEPTETPTEEPTEAPTEEPTDAPAVPDEQPGANPAAMRLSHAVTLTRHLATGEESGPYLVLDATTGSLANATMQLRDASLTEAPKADEWITVETADATYTVYAGETCYVLEEKNGMQSYYIAEGPYAYRLLKIVFDKLEYNASRIAVQASDAESALSAYASEAYPKWLRGLLPGSIFSCQNYAFVDYEVIASEENLVLGKYRFTAEYEQDFYPYTVQGTYEDGQGEYEGKTVFSASVVLERQQDGNWYAVPVGAYTVLYDRDYPAADLNALDPEDPNVVAAKEYLANAAEIFAACQLEAGEDPVRALVDLSDLFLRCVTAANACGQVDFDFSPFYMPGAMENLGPRALYKERIDRDPMPQNFTSGSNDPIHFEMAQIMDGKAVIYSSQMTLYWAQGEDGVWRITDLVMPYAST